MVAFSCRAIGWCKSVGGSQGGFPGIAWESHQGNPGLTDFSTPGPFF